MRAFCNSKIPTTWRKRRFSARLRHSQKIQMSYVSYEYTILFQKGGRCEYLIYILLKSTQNLFKFRSKFEFNKRHNINGIGRWNSFKSIYHEILALWAEERKSFETFDISRITTSWIQHNWNPLIDRALKEQKYCECCSATPMSWLKSPNLFRKKNSFWGVFLFLAGGNANFLWRPNSFRFQALHPSIFRTAANLPIIIIKNGQGLSRKMTFWDRWNLFVVAHPAWWLTVFIRYSVTWEAAEWPAGRSHLRSGMRSNDY